MSTYIKVAYFFMAIAKTNEKIYITAPSHFQYFKQEYSCTRK